MDRTELRTGLRAFRDLIEGYERILADPEAIPRMQRRAIEDPSLLLGPTVDEYLGLDIGENPFQDFSESPLDQGPE